MFVMGVSVCILVGLYFCVCVTTNHKLKNLSQGEICIFSTITAPVHMHVWVFVGVVKKNVMGHFQATDCEYFSTWCLRTLKMILTCGMTVCEQVCERVWVFVVACI